jgi:hypothetical protein
MPQQAAPQKPSRSFASDSTPRPGQRGGGAGGVRGNSFANGFGGPPDNVSRGLYGEARGQWEGVA